MSEISNKPETGVLLFDTARLTRRIAAKTALLPGLKPDDQWHTTLGIALPENAVFYPNVGTWLEQLLAERHARVTRQLQRITLSYGPYGTNLQEVIHDSNTVALQVLGRLCLAPGAIYKHEVIGPHELPQHARVLDMFAHRQQTTLPPSE